MELDTIEKLLREIEHLQKAKELLEEIWTKLGPYNYNSVLPMELQIKFNNFMDFDDSE